VGQHFYGGFCRRTDWWGLVFFHVNVTSQYTLILQL
jgi:hypothetical protein